MNNHPTNTLTQAAWSHLTTGTRLLTTVVIFGCFAALHAQERGASPADVPPDPNLRSEDVIQLATFEVSISQDVGYRAGNSVSATRIDTPIQNLPFAVNAFTEQFIGDIGARELYDIVRFAPGVTTSSREYTGGNTRFAIRGFDQLRPQRNGFIGDTYVDAINIQRVEIVKGPASLLYGQIAPGGTVNYITKRPLSKRAATVTQQIGTDNFWRTEIDVNQPASERLLFRFNGAWENSPEWVDRSRTRTWVIAPTATWKINDRSSVTIDYQWFRRREKQTEHHKPNMTLNLARDPVSADPAIAGYRAGLVATRVDLGFLGHFPLPRDFHYTSHNDRRNTDFESLNVEYTAALGEHWTARANYSWGRRRAYHKLTGQGIVTLTPPAGTSFYDFAAQVLADPTRALDSSTALLNRRKRLEENFGFNNAFQIEVAGRFDFGWGTFKPLVGAFLNNDHTTGRIRQSTTNPPAGVADEDTTPAQNFQPWNMLDPSSWTLDTNFDPAALAITPANYNITFSKDTAAYAVGNFSLFEDRLMVIGGLRYSTAKSRLYNYARGAAYEADPIPANNPYQPVDGPYKASKLTPQAGVGYKMTRDIMLYASYSESFAVTDRILESGGVPVSAARPITASGYEAGIKTDLFSGRVSSTIALFQIDQKDRVLRYTDRTPAGAVITTTLQGTGDRSSGIEAEITLSPLDNWQIYLSGAYVDMHVTSIPEKSLDPATIPAGYTPEQIQVYTEAYLRGTRALIGTRPEANARKTASIWTRYTFKTGPAKGLWIGGGASYTGDKAQRVDNPLLFIPSYTLIDLAGGYDWKWRDTSMSATINWKNVTDREHIPANQVREQPGRAMISISATF